MASHLDCQPIISVLMPVYNCALYIKEAVDSILNQTFDDFEFLIIDDGSSDDTIRIIKSYVDSRIKLIEKVENSGISNSLNLGLSIAKGKYIARMDGDDISLPERFEKQVAFLDSNHDIILCGSWLRVIDSDRVIKVPENHEKIKLALLKGNCIIHPSVMMRKQFLDEFSVVYNVSKEPAEDYDLWVRLILIGKLYNIQEVLLNYRIHSFSVSQKNLIKQNEIALDIRLHLLSYLDCILEHFEIDILKKIFKRDKIKFKEIKLFNKLKIKLIKSNYNCFFEEKGLKKYLNEIEYIMFNKCILEKKHIIQLIYIEYFKIKNKINLKLIKLGEFNFLIK